MRAGLAPKSCFESIRSSGFAPLGAFFNEKCGLRDVGHCPACGQGDWQPNKEHVNDQLDKDARFVTWRFGAAESGNTTRFIIV
jgi:hypothetical protein